MASMNNLLVFLLIIMNWGGGSSLSWRINSSVPLQMFALQGLHVTLEVIFFPCLHTNEFSINNFMFLGFLTLVWSYNQFLILWNLAHSIA